MRIIELFSGTKSISNAFEKKGHEVFTIDNNPKLEPDLCIDILKLTIDDIPGEFKEVLLFCSAQ